MKNLLLALAGTLMLSSAADAQQIYIDISNSDVSCGKYYYPTVTNNNGGVINLQMADNGGWGSGCSFPSNMNVTMNLNAGQITLSDIGLVLTCDDFQPNSIGGTYFDMARYYTGDYYVWVYVYDVPTLLDLLAPCYAPCDDEPVVCPEDLTSTVDSLEAIINAQQITIDQLNTDLTNQGNTLASCQDNFANWQSFTAGVQADLLACDNLTDSLYQALADLSTDLAVATADAEYFELLADDCATTLADTLAFYDEVLIGAGTAINGLTADLEACEDEYSDLDDQFTTAVFDYEAYIDSLNAIISAVPATIEAIVTPLEEELAAAQAAASACPDAIETAVANALATCQGDAIAAWQDGYDFAAEQCNDSCLVLLNEAYDGGVADGIAYAEDELFPPLLEAEWNLGYNAGLADCDGEVSGLVDIDGTTIPVIGYYNELGQTINPNTTDGVIIRRHADGTFSKYIKTLR